MSVFDLGTMPTGSKMYAPTKTLLSRVTGTSLPGLKYCIPACKEEWEQCCVILRANPHWRELLPRVATEFPEWKTFVDYYLSLEDLGEGKVA